MYMYMCMYALGTHVHCINVSRGRELPCFLVIHWDVFFFPFFLTFGLYTDVLYVDSQFCTCSESMDR